MNNNGDAKQLKIDINAVDREICRSFLLGILSHEVHVLDSFQCNYFVKVWPKKASGLSHCP